MPLGPPTERINREAYHTTWPMSAEKCELWDGIVVWTGQFDEDDVERARRTFPDRKVVLEDGALCLYPADA